MTAAAVTGARCGRGDFRLEVSDGIARVTIATPDGLNGYTRANLAPFAALVREAAAAPADFVLLTGEGANFCIGASAGLLTEMREMPRPSLERFIRDGQEVIRAVVDCDRIVVAQVNGFAAGGGMDLLLACDMAYADRGARLNLFYSRLGVLPDHGGLFFLDERLGSGAGRREYLANRRYGAEEAVAARLIDGLSPEDVSNAGWHRHLSRALPVPLSVMVALKRLRRAERGEALEEHLTAMAGLQADLLGGADQRARIDRVAAMQAAGLNAPAAAAGAR